MTTEKRERLIELAEQLRRIAQDAQDSDNTGNFYPYYCALWDVADDIEIEAEDGSNGQEID